MKNSLFGRLRKDMQVDGWTPRHLVAVVVFGAIVLVFVFFGMSGRHNAIGAGAVAQVNSTLISVGELNQETQRLEQMYAPMFGGQIQSDMQRQFIKGQALESLISNELLVQGAAQMGVLATDQEVRKVITEEIPVFQNEGRFQRDRYLGLLEANRLTPGEFEKKIRKERQSQRLRRVFEWASSPTKQEIVNSQTLKEKKREVEFAKLEKSQLLEKIKVDSGEVAKKLQDQEFAKKVASEFEVNKAQYSTEEQVKAQHILIRTNSQNPDSEKEALSKIKEISLKANKEDFGKLASQYSEDPGSKMNKGDLGWFGRGKMVPEFDKVAFAQKVGTISEPIKTEFGYHLIKVNEHKPEVVAKLETVQNKIAQKIIASSIYDEEFKKIEEAMKQKDISSVDAALRALNVNWQDSGYFDWSQDIVPSLGAVATAEAFALNQENKISTQPIRDGGAVYILKFKSDKTEKLPLDEKTSEALARESSYELLTAWLENFKKSAQVEKNISDSQRF